MLLIYKLKYTLIDILMYLLYLLSDTKEILVLKNDIVMTFNWYKISIGNNKNELVEDKLEEINF